MLRDLAPFALWLCPRDRARIIQGEYRVKDELVRRAAAAEEQARGPIILAGVENADLTRILRQAQDAGPGGAAEHKRSDKTARRVKEFRDEAVELVRTVRLRTRNDLFWAGVK